MQYLAANRAALRDVDNLRWMQQERNNKEQQKEKKVEEQKERVAKEQKETEAKKQREKATKGTFIPFSSKALFISAKFCASFILGAVNRTNSQPVFTILIICSTDFCVSMESVVVML